ncbi:MAG: universal stress protein [Candidatus Binatus sp.]|uniref:universal stress protein n=1 Tax=Candidatus Binatus sp. TaxID=2811406 RepID=UPI002717A670|nr:universal stress protein [Candidatus Binatus sp.]MDO8432617.1 universal stress protein [Candidatus Binatus sp.]
MTQLFRKILCPIDFAEHSLAALEVALQLAQQNDAALHLLSIAPTPAGAAGFQPVPMEPYPYVEKDMRQQLDNLARERIPPTTRCETHVVSGDPAERVLAAARDLGVDLIVMGTHGRKGLSHLVLGSVAERVVRESPVPVLTTHSTARVRKIA